MGARGPRLTELVARDLLLHGTRPRQAWRYAAELSQREAAGRFNQLTGNPRAPMTGNRIGDYEQWPDGGVRPTVATLKILADAYGTTWDQLVDAHDLAQMPGGDRLEYLESGHVRPGRPPRQPARTSRGPGGAGRTSSSTSRMSRWSSGSGQACQRWRTPRSSSTSSRCAGWPGSSSSARRCCRCCWRPGGCGTMSPPGFAATPGSIRPGTCTCSPPRSAACWPG